MDVLTLYSDQGSLVGIRTGNEGIIVDAHMPECDHVTPGEIQQSLSIYFKGVAVRGLILTGFDADHAHSVGAEWLLSTLSQIGLCTRNISKTPTMRRPSFVRSISMRSVAPRQTAH